MAAHSLWQVSLTNYESLRKTCLPPTANTRNSKPRPPTANTNRRGKSLKPISTILANHNYNLKIFQLVSTRTFWSTHVLGVKALHMCATARCMRTRFHAKRTYALFLSDLCVSGYVLGCVTLWLLNICIVCHSGHPKTSAKTSYALEQGQCCQVLAVVIIITTVRVWD